MMVERVARAICESEKMNPDDALGGWKHWTEAARAAIEAMREPTDGMMDAAEDTNTGGGVSDNGGGEPDNYDPGNVWRAMIAAALK